MLRMTASENPVSGNRVWLQGCSQRNEEISHPRAVHHPGTFNSSRPIQSLHAGHHGGGGGGGGGSEGGGQPIKSSHCGFRVNCLTTCMFYYVYYAY